MNNTVDYVTRYNSILKRVAETNPEQSAEVGKVLFDDVKDILESFGNYSTAIYNMEIQVPYIRFRYEPEDQAYHIEQLDQARKSAHDNAMAQAGMLNRWCRDFLGLPPFIDLDENAHRGEWTEVLMEVVRQFVDAGILPKQGDKS